MSRFFKSAAFPILIVVVLAFFAQRLIGGTETQKVPNYDQFLTQVDSGQIKDLTLNTKDNTLDVVLKQAPKRDASKYSIGYPSNTEQNLVNTLRDNSVPFDVKGKGGGGWLTVLTYVSPFVIFLLF